MVKRIFRRIRSLFTTFKSKDKKDRVFMVKVVGVIFALLLGGFLIFSSGRDVRKMIMDSEKILGREEKTKDVGLFVGDVETKTYFTRLEKEYYDISERVDVLEFTVNKFDERLKEIRGNQSDISKAILSLDERITEKIDKEFRGLKAELERGLEAPGTEDSLSKEMVAGIPYSTPTSGIRLEIAKLSEIQDKKEVGDKYVYLPIGSFCRGTLLTGVYAPADQSNPLPVLISLNEAFYGPNNSRIPLKGAFAIGKAVGDIVSKRAVIQIVAISTVYRNGEAFEFEGNLGYVTDNAGQLGIPGEIVYNTGRQLSLNFLSGFLAGMAEAFAEKETTSVIGGEGQVAKNITGSDSKYALFSGLSQSAGNMSEHYQKQLESMIPAVKVGSGEKIFFVVQQGVEIEGLKLTRNTDYGYID